jgi:succinoglycan biosynthesis protein ExoA
MSVAIVLSTYNERAYVDRCLDAIAGQTVSPRVVVIDGGSSDGTVERLRERAAADSRIEVICDGVRRTLPEALNLGIARAGTRYVAKVDARTFIAPDFLEQALAIFEGSGDGIACIGGQPEQYGETRFGQGLARARMSRFGVGASGYADRRPRADVETVQCGVYRRDALLAVGGFDPGLQFGEDEELNWKLRRAGYRIVRDCHVRLSYVTRPTWRGAFRQYRNYGVARTDVLRKHPEFLKPHHFAPSLMVLAGASLAIASAFSPAARRLLAAAAAAYGAGALAAALASRRRKDDPIFPTMAAFSALHLGYGVGLLQGLLRGIPSRPAGTTNRTARH